MLRLVSLLAVLAASGCYAPDLQDCTVTCGGSDECAGDQVCNSNGRCAAEGVSCTGATPDAASAMITLRVQVGGTGKVVIAGVGECDESECTWQVPMATLRLDARATDDEKPFERWTTMNCMPALQPSCMVTPTGSTTVGAKFR
jgi:hypothetical protein